MPLNRLLTNEDYMTLHSLYRLSDFYIFWPYDAFGNCLIKKVRRQLRLAHARI